MNDRGLRQITVTIDPKKNITYKTFHRYLERKLADDPCSSDKH